jgi:hypothetical protein
VIPSQLQTRFAPRPHLRTRNVPSFSKRRSRSLSFTPPLRSKQTFSFHISHFHISDCRTPLPESAHEELFRIVSNQLQTPLAPPFNSLPSRSPFSLFLRAEFAKGIVHYMNQSSLPFHKVKMHIHYLYTCTNPILRFLPQTFPLSHPLKETRTQRAPHKPPNSHNLTISSLLPLHLGQISSHPISSHLISPTDNFTDTAKN